MRNDCCPNCGSRVKVQSSKYSHYVWCTNPECDWDEDTEADFDDVMQYKMSSHYYD